MKVHCADCGKALTRKIEKRAVCQRCSARRYKAKINREENELPIHGHRQAIMDVEGGEQGDIL